MHSHKLYCDLETYSPIPIKHGTHAYAEEAEIMLFAWAIDDEPVNVWDLTNGEPMPERLRDALNDPRMLTIWHNGGMFDLIVLKHALGIDIPLERVHDTLVQALLHGLPGALGTLCEILKVPTDLAKDKAGKSLIQLFCKPRPKNSKIRRATRETHPKEWGQFVSYAGSDIEAMRFIKLRLPTWNLIPFELDLWRLDQKINRRGMCMDIALARGALKAVEAEQIRLASRTQEITEGAVQSATQRDAMLQHILRAFGVHLPDMRASTLQGRIDDPELPEALRELLRVRLAASTTSTSKYSALLNSVSSDGRLRGTKQFCGAFRSKRWAGRLFQPDNLPRPTLLQDVIDEGIEALKLGCADILFDNIMELTSSALRGCITVPTGKKLSVSDLSNIEGRLLAWLAGEEWKLQAFRDYDTFLLDAKGNQIPTDDGKDFKRRGPDLYCLSYAKSFGIRPEDVDKGQRQKGKVQELALGYEGGVGAFVTFSLAYGIDLEEMAEGAYDTLPAWVVREATSAYNWAVKQKRTYGLSARVYVVCDAFKRLWRAAHPQTVSFWADLENTVRKAIANPNQMLTCRRLKIRRRGSWLRIILPSGGSLSYPGIRIEDGKVSYMGVNQYTRKWQRLKTYGGKLVENVCQAVARDVLANNMHTIEDAGYEIVLTVHDEVLTETPDTPDYSHEHLSALLSTVPHWAPELPLSAGGFEAYHYRKD